jgi:two-component system chemotaxis sensor kinase CheA
MENGDTLTHLAEQAACCFNTLSPADRSDAQELQDVLRQIRAVAGAMKGEPVDLQTQLEGAAAEATGALEQMMQQEVRDTTQAMAAVSQAICTIQGLCQQLAEPPVASPTPSAPPAPPAPADGAPGQPGTATISDEDAPLVQDFITEANEHVETAESAMLELESHPQNGELVNKIFRSFHTIKGMAGFLNLADIQSLAHAAEGLLDLVRKGQLVLAGASSDVVFESIDVLKKMLVGLKTALESRTPVASYDGLPSLLEKLKAVVEGKAVVGLQPQAGPPPRTAPQPQPGTPEEDKRLDTILEDPADTNKKTAGTSATEVSDEKIRVSTTRLDNLINMTGELVIAQLMVAEEISGARTFEPEMARKVAHQGKIVRELQDLSMAMRMVPIRSVFQKMTRLARDVSHKAGKQVDFVTLGEETELDRTVVDRISDPLVHMVRNAIDHGIEPGEQRTQAGKKPAGRVELRAFHQAGSIVIEMEDDGRGLDKDRILKKAVDHGLVSSGQELPEEDIFKLIFHAGLSTAEKVTSVSGRGVGMDVVKKNIEALRGRIDIRSARGKGTTFTIRLPLTLAVIDGQVVRIGRNRYIIPITSILRSLRPAPQQVSTVHGRGEVILERGELMPLIRLYRLFGVTPTTEDPTRALVVIVEADGRKCCLLVDDLLAQQQVVIKNLGEMLGRMKGVSGGAIMGDGRVTLILDIPGLVELAQRQQGTQGLPS